MSMSLLYNIEKFNNTVTIQSSVLMHTDIYSILSFSIQYTEGALRPVSSDITTHFVRPFELPWCSTVSVHVFAPARGQCLLCVCQHPLSKSKEQYTCYSKLRYIHVRIYVMKIHRALHVIM